MSLFQCEECGCVENTACCNYAYRVYCEKKKPLCSICDPNINKWHGRFDRTFLPKGMFKTNQAGNLEHIENGDEDYHKYAIDQ